MELNNPGKKNALSHLLVEEVSDYDRKQASISIDLYVRCKRLSAS